MKTISFIGAGNMAFAMANALFRENKNVAIGVYDIDKARLELFKSSFDTTRIYPSIEELVEDSNIVILSVKPQVIESVLPIIRNTKKIVLSIAAGVTLDYLTSMLPNASVARVMPNTPSLVSHMAAGVSFSNKVTKNEKKEILEFLKYSGIALEVKDNLMDAVTGISGSGPAFVARIIDFFIKSGVKNGLDPDVSRELATNTFLGTAKLIIDNNMDIENLIKMVSSPGGTTIAGRGVLESSNIGEIIDATVNATIKRSKELGNK